jgi:hypothetical protein
MGGFSYNRRALRIKMTIRHLTRRLVPVIGGIVSAAFAALAALLPAGAQTPQPPPTPTRSPTTTPVAPVARIVTPVRGQVLGASVTAQGSANVPGFSRYEIAYASEPDAKTWQVFGGGTQPVDNGLLSTWNTRALAAGEYALRLQVFSADGKSIESVVRNLKVEGAAAAATGVSTPGAASGTPRPATSATPGAVATPAALDSAAIPRAFLRGAEIVGLAFAAFLGYLILKKVLGFAIGRLFRRPIDYGK